MRHETAIFGQKNKSEIQKFQLSFFAFQQQKTPKLAETPIL